MNQNIASTRFLSLAAIAAVGFVSAPVQADTALMDQWRAYARNAMQPEFDWADKAPVVAPSVVQRSLVVETTIRAIDFGSQLDKTPLRFGFGSGLATDSPSTTSALGALKDTDAARFGLLRNELTAGIERPLDARSSLTASVVLVRQQFASFGLGTETISDYTQAQQLATEASVGTGVRVGYQQALSSTVSWGTAVQSRISMDSFQSYRGVFADPGDFDVPGQASLTALWQPTSGLDLMVSAQRVFYSELTPFSSASLPIRFLSLLNDGSSPEFKWHDLDVLVADVGVQLAKSDRLNLRYSTQQQPDPTSGLLRDALANGATNLNLALGLEHSFQRFGRLRLAASYAPAEIYLGNVSGLGNSLDTSSQIEGEASWQFQF